MFAAALLMAAGLFIKHNLLALPLAAALWLFWQDRRDGAALCRWRAGSSVSRAWSLSRLFLGVDLLAALAQPRLGPGQFRHRRQAFLRWAGAALLIAAGAGLAARRTNAAGSLRFMPALALLLGGLFAFGDGVDANIFFDAAIALSLERGPGADASAPTLDRNPGGLASAAPLALFLAHQSRRGEFSLYRSLRPRGAAGYRLPANPSRSGALRGSDALLLGGQGRAGGCVQSVRSLSRPARAAMPIWRSMLETQYFGSVVLDSLTDFCPGPASAKPCCWRITASPHDDDNGVFLERR